MDGMHAVNVLRAQGRIAWAEDPHAAGTAHLFIVNPFSGGAMLRLFSTHPPTEARVERLVALAGTGRASGQRA